MLSHRTHKEKHHTHGVSGRLTDTQVPQHKMPDKGVAPVVAHQMISDFINLDGELNQNMATFLTTYCDKEAESLMVECLSRNFADRNAYPHMMQLHDHCVDMLSDLFHVPHGQSSVGIATVGSSEAFELGALSLKFRWREKMQKKLGVEKVTATPNLVFGCNAQICIEKFARYFDVEPRKIPISEDRHFVTDFSKLRDYVDENTIGVVAILGSTFTGQFEHVAQLQDELDKIHAENPELDIPIHVDAASGGFVAPFAFPKLRWDFALPRVVSINVSGHKYGLTYAGLGWVVWRANEMLHPDLLFSVDYIGGPQPTYTLNFSRPSAMMVCQYYNFIRLGRKGYANVIASCLDSAKLLAELLKSSGYFIIRSELDYTHGALPLVAFSLNPDLWDNNPLLQFTEFDLSNSVRRFGWLVPAYHLPESCKHIAICRVVIREEHTSYVIEALARDFVVAARELRKEREGVCRRVLEATKSTQPIQMPVKREEGVPATVDELTRDNILLEEIASATKKHNTFAGVC